MAEPEPLSVEELRNYDFVFWRAGHRPGPTVPAGLTPADVAEWAGKFGCRPEDMWIGKVGPEDDRGVEKIRNGGPWRDDDPEVWLWDMDWHSTTTFVYIREHEPNGFRRAEGQAKWIDRAYPVLDVRPYALAAQASADIANADEPAATFTPIPVPILDPPITAAPKQPSRTRKRAAAWPPPGTVTIVRDPQPEPPGFWARLFGRR